MGQELSEYPILEGGVLQEECDHAFWCAFKDLRDEENGELDYVLDRNHKFPCVTNYTLAKVIGLLDKYTVRSCYKKTQDCVSSMVSCL